MFAPSTRPTCSVVKPSATPPDPSTTLRFGREMGVSELRMNLVCLVAPNSPRFDFDNHSRASKYRNADYRVCDLVLW